MEETLLQTLTMEQPVGVVVDISLAVGEVVGEAAEGEMMVEKEGRLERYS